MTWTSSLATTALCNTRTPRSIDTQNSCYDFSKCLQINNTKVGGWRGEAVRWGNFLALNVIFPM